MIKVSNTYIDVKIEDFDLPYGAMEYIITSEELDGTIPTCEIKIMLTKPDELLKILKMFNVKISIGMGTDESNIHYNNFTMSDYSYSRKGRQFLFTFYSILDIKPYTNNAVIKSYKDKTSSDVLKIISTVKPDIRYTGNDKMTWLQPNTPDKEFVKRVMSKAYVSDTDSIIYAINMDAKLIADTITGAFKKPEKLKMSDNPEKGDVVFDSYSIDTNASMYQYLFSEGTQLPVLHIDKPNTELIGIDQASVMNKKVYNNTAKNKSMVIQIDCMNVHPKYYTSHLLNLKHKMDLVSKPIRVEIQDKVFNEDELTLMDTIKVIEKNSDLTNQLIGLYLVGKKSTYISPESVSTEIFLVRDFYTE